MLNATATTSASDHPKHAGTETRTIIIVSAVAGGAVLLAVIIVILVFVIGNITRRRNAKRVKLQPGEGSETMFFASD